MFHYSNFGSFGSNLKPYADLDGYVPQLQDKQESGNWPDKRTDSEWGEFLVASMRATSQAQAELDSWRDKKGPGRPRNPPGASGTSPRVAGRVDAETKAWMASQPEGETDLIKAGLAMLRESRT